MGESIYSRRAATNPHTNGTKPVEKKAEEKTPKASKEDK